MSGNTGAIVAAALLVLGCAEQLEYRFETGAAALASDVARRGWVPAWLPPAARDVHVQHDLDTNEAWLRFELEDGERRTLVGALTAVPPPEAAAMRIRSPRRATWWLEAGDGALEPAVFRGPDRVVLFDESGPRVFVYLPGR